MADLSGLDEMPTLIGTLDGALAAAVHRVGDGALAAAGDTAIAILDRALYYCPIDTGKLRDSGTLQPLEESGTGALGYAEATYAVTFGNAEVPYAVVVHERTDIAHAAPTQAKFLQQAVMDQEDGLLGRMGAATAAQLRGGGSGGGGPLW